MSIRKADYIAKYGQDAWEKESERRKEYNRNNREKKAEYNKQYRLNKIAENPDWDKQRRERALELHPDYYKEMYQKRITKNPDYCKELYHRNRELHPDYYKEWYQKLIAENPDYNKIKYEQKKEKDPEYTKKVYQRILKRYPDIVEKTKKWRNETGFCKKYRKTKNGRSSGLFYEYIKIDKNKGFDTSNNIDKDWIINNIFNSSCVYCGDSDWTHLGADRIDNSKPHTPENCVCACGLCNMERSDKYTVEEFKEYRSLHPRSCDVPKGPTILLSETGALKKRAID